MDPLFSSIFIASNAKFISLNEAKLEELSNMLYNSVISGDFNINSWSSHELHPKTHDETSVNWIFFIDLLNFSFWTEEPKYSVEYHQKHYTGYFSLCAALKKCIENGIKLYEPKVFANITKEDLAKMLESSSETQIPLLEERLASINEAGKILLTKFDGSFLNCVKQAENSAQRLLEIIVDNFPSFRDVSTYDGKEVSFYKRAQILIADLWLCFEGQSYGYFQDIDTLTAFADYRVPQVLAYFGAISYDQTLLDKLKKKELLPNGSPEEVELRGFTILACERLKDLTLVKLRNDNFKGPFNSILIDNFLWNYRRNHADEIEDVIPMHRTRCIYY